MFAGKSSKNVYLTISLTDCKIDPNWEKFHNIPGDIVHGHICLCVQVCGYLGKGLSKSDDLHT